MAIISTVKTDFGIDCHYSIISAYREDKEFIFVSLSSYVDEEARNGKMTDLECTDYAVALSNAPVQPLKTQLYQIPKYPHLDIINIEGFNHIKYAYIKLCESYGFEGDE
jgi:hypothetical protein